MKKEMTYAVFTDRGDREINEDSIGVYTSEENCCFILCDGLGGHGMGDVASSFVVDVFKNRFEQTNDMVNFVGETFCAAQDMLMAEQKARNAGRKMKTTGVVVVTDDRNTYIGHVGDSRAYVFSKNKVRCRTQDHSIPQMLVLSGEIKESEIRNHPDRNTLLRVLGIGWEEPKCELMAPISKKKCQAFLLCSDGFWELVDEKEMCSLLRRAKTVDEWLQSMLEIVKANGTDQNMDNFSAIAVWL